MTKSLLLINIFDIMKIFFNLLQLIILIASLHVWMEDVAAVTIGCIGEYLDTY